ncbi:MAG: HAMP domain-containing histidine kinase, partial [Methylococcales bacterium]|nr:HAMP domain-containing histidine kinase [Methylococcales bacterium]
PQQQILSINVTALALFQAENPLKLEDISPPLATLFQDWQRNPKQDFFTVQSAQKANLHLRFNLLMTENQAFYMIMLEDVALHNQRLQQGVLASLGRLTASIAHEIRNPLSAITHATQLLSENPELSPQDLRLTEIIIKHSARVNKIITDILKSSKRTPSNRKELRLNIFLETYLQDFQTEQSVDETYLSLELCDLTLETRIDVGHLRQIMDNLCQNALKYGSPEKGGVVIRLSHLGATPIIDVIDQGILLDSDIITHLFEPFFTTSNSGTGLGLYLSRELAELNQASLSYRVSNQKNNSFRLQLSNAKKLKIEL